jgi:hypothetical protein
MTKLHHQEVQKTTRAWHDRNLRKKQSSIRDLVLLYDSKIKGKPRKMDIAQLGPYVIEHVRKNREMKLGTLQWNLLHKAANGSNLKRYHTLKKIKKAMVKTHLVPLSESFPKN